MVDTRRVLFILAAISAVVFLYVPDVRAEEAPLTGDDIRAVLSGVMVAGIKDGQPWHQSFTPTGQTTYYSGSGAPSDGFWRVEKDAYCSKWPPFGGWVCYDMTGDLSGEPKTVTFIGHSGETWPAEVQPKTTE